MRCQPSYEPTPVEIAEACREIVESWTPRERFWRRRGCDMKGNPIIGAAFMDGRKRMRSAA